MSYFLTERELQLNSIIEIGGEEARHILLSRRMKPGEKFTLQDARPKRFEAEVIKAGKNVLEAKILRETAMPQEPGTAVTLYQSYVQEKALDFILQKSTELGASKITLFNSANTSTRLSQEQFGRKLDRWNKILWESAKQCDRAVIPQLGFVESVAKVIDDAKNLDKVFVLDASGDRILNPKFSILNSLGLIIGPEGGFTPLEIDQFKSTPGIELVSLGPLTLRADTAALAVLAIVRGLQVAQ